MSTFIVIMDPGGAARGPEVKSRLQEKFKEVYEFSPTAFLVAADTLTVEVARAGGIKGEGQMANATGAVFRIDNYSGYSDRSLWEWLAKVEA